MGDKIFVKKPSVFKQDSNDDFSIWYAQFANFAEAAKLAKADVFGALCSYLDNAAFSIVQNLELSAEVRGDPDKFRPFLEKSLGFQDKIPPRLALKYRTQKPDESLADFAVALSKLATKAATANATKEETLVDSFCTGVRDTDMSIKLLENNFTTLSLALEQAKKIEGASKIRDFVRPNTNSNAELEILASSETNKRPSKYNAQSTNPFLQPTMVEPADRNRGQVTVAWQGALDHNAQNFQPGRNEHVQYHENSRAGASHGYRFQNNRYNPGRNGYPSVQGRVGPANRAAQSQKRCWYCNRPGHLIRNCKTKARDEAQNFAPGPGPRQ